MVLDVEHDYEPWVGRNEAEALPLKLGLTGKAQRLRSLKE